MSTPRTSPTPSALARASRASSQRESELNESARTSESSGSARASELNESARASELNESARTSELARASETGASSQAGLIVAVCVAALALPLSFSGGAVATPAIGRALGGGPEALSWITNAFMLSFGSFLMAAGSLADGLGRKRVFVVGVAGFALASLATGLAPSLAALDALRAVQGAAAAAAMAGGSAALANALDGAARTRAFGLLGTTFGIGLAAGPLIAGALIEALGWRAIFLSGTVLGGISLALGAPRMRESRDPGATRLDVAGVLAFTVALSLLTFGVIQAPRSGWTSPLVVGLLLGAVIVGMAFIAIELHSARPMLELSLFRYPRFVGVQVLPIATCYAFVVLLVVLPLRFIGIEGLSETAAGVRMLALSAPMVVVPIAAAYATRWRSPGELSALGLAIAAVGLVWLAQRGPGSSTAALVGPLLTIGVGTGLPWGLMDGLSVSVVPKERAGMATGIFSTTRVAGEGIALASVTAALAGLIAHQLGRLEGATRGLEGATRGLEGATPALGSIAPDLVDAARRLASGDLRGAQVVLPRVDPAQLVDGYAGALRALLYALAAITFVAAITVFGFLGRRARDAAIQ